MNNTRKRKGWWVIVTGIVLALLLVWFSPLRRPVVALYDMQHSIDVFLRFHSEILEKTSAGLYYSDLMMEHGYEQYEILQAHPEHFDEFWHVVELFTPGIEALTDGRGDTVLITEEYINSLKKEWEWESQFASDTMQEDVEKELQRFPLDTFVGMTFSEAWDYVNANFPPNLTWQWGETSLPPTSTPTSLPTPMGICLVGTLSVCEGTPSPVLDEGGQWGYFVKDGIYFEYPSNWRIEQKDGMYIQLVPSQDSPEAHNVSIIYFGATKTSMIQLEDSYDPLSFPQTMRSYPEPKWQQLISLSDFEGSEFFYEVGPYSYLEIIIYDPDTQEYIHSRVEFLPYLPSDFLIDAKDVAKQYPNFQHILESLRYE